MQQREFLQQFRGIIGEYSASLSGSFGEYDPEVANAVREGIYNIIANNVDDPPTLVAQLESLTFGMFMAGREHSIRGHGRPEKNTFQKPNIPNTPSEINWGDNDDRV